VEEIVEETQPLPEEPVPNIVFVKAKKKKERKSLQPTIQVLVSLVTAIVAVSGIVLSYMSARTQRDTARSNRFTSAIGHLKDDSLAIRMGALFELKKLGLEEPQQQQDIVRILGPFIREGIENSELLLPPRATYDLARPNEDVFIACEIVSLFYEESQISVELSYLKADNLNFEGISLQGANLSYASFQGCVFGVQSGAHEANLQEASLIHSSFEKSQLWGINLQRTALNNANLQETELNASNLYVASLFSANLRYSDITGADLRGASLDMADLEGVELYDIEDLDQLLGAVNIELDNLNPSIRTEYARQRAEREENFKHAQAQVEAKYKALREAYYAQQPTQEN